MVSSILDKKAIELRLAHLAELEESGRSAVLFAGHSTWLLGDAIKATLADVRSLLEAANGDASRPIVDALVGTLRAHGYAIANPTWGDDQSAVPPKSDTTPAPPRNMFAEEIGGDSSEHGPDPMTYCLNCGTTLPIPGGPCRYSDCAAPAPAPLEEGSLIRIVGGLHDGRHARVGIVKSGSLACCVALLGRSVVPVGAVEVPHERLVVVGDDPDATAAEVTPEPARNEPARTAAEWQPTAAQIREYATKLGKTEEHVKESVLAFKVATATSSPDLKMKRWGKTFVDWAEAQLAAD